MNYITLHFVLLTSLILLRNDPFGCNISWSSDLAFINSLTGALTVFTNVLGISCNVLICGCKSGCNTDCKKLFPIKCGNLVIVFRAGCKMEFKCGGIGSGGICGNGGICGRGICGKEAPTIESDEVVFESCSFISKSVLVLIVGVLVFSVSLSSLFESQSLTKCA